ncbi:hypothetical protein KIN20_036181 [Parelaphostrongylus tenuis]|uniref:Uncharacterized protein n=1 Tax=Parelaphostrongylus tenuis TaxID=148309 RepID=A0AAD5WKG4_PARTN|nr:hypothetical protein KIN20_036181 [Parelaphostrongylus tenuis]
MHQQGGAVSLYKNGHIALRIFAKPGAKINSVTNVGDDEISVAIAAPPREGEANEELVDYMRKLLDLRKSELTLDKGGKSRLKTLLITSSRISPEEVIAKLKGAVKA